MKLSIKEVQSLQETARVLSNQHDHKRQRMWKLLYRSSLDIKPDLLGLAVAHAGELRYEREWNTFVFTPGPIPEAAKALQQGLDVFDVTLRAGNQTCRYIAGDTQEHWLVQRFEMWLDIGGNRRAYRA